MSRPSVSVDHFIFAVRRLCRRVVSVNFDHFGFVGYNFLLLVYTSMVTDIFVTFYRLLLRIMGSFQILQAFDKPVILLPKSHHLCVLNRCNL